VKRREFIALAGGAAATWPLAAHAQQPAGRVYRVGYLSIGSEGQQLHLIKAFEAGLRSRGYRVGENVVIEYRFANGEMERLPALAADLVRLGVDVIVTGNASAVATMQATATIPIVFYIGVDPVEIGLVSSLNRPGGNLTGVSNLGVEIGPKRLELLHGLIPTARSFAALVNSNRSNLEKESENSVIPEARLSRILEF